MKIAIIILGCHIYDILQDRFDEGLNQWKNCVKENNDCYFLFSGNRYNYKRNLRTEADSLQRIALKNGIEKNKIILEKYSTNTAENAAYSSKIIAENNIDKCIIVTSKYHEKRATRIFTPFFYNIEHTWGFSEKECSTCKSDEEIHLRNVISDINKAKKKLINNC